MTAEGVVMGTVGYMSPEQRLGRAVDHRTDIVALAVMLIEVLTGQQPFRDDADPQRPAAEVDRAAEDPRRS